MARSRPIPTAIAVPGSNQIVPTAVPVDANDISLILELVGRPPTWNERFLISGDTFTFGSTNVKEMWWNWRNTDMFVRFLDGSLYVYHQVPLSIAVGFLQTPSPGRYVWSVLRVSWPTPVKAQRLQKGASRKGRRRPRPQVVRLVP